MAEIVASAVASEGISRISSFLSGDRATQESAKDKAERLEMAVLKIQSVVAVCEDLRISHLPLRRWKAKLKRVAMEGDSLLHVHKKKILECNNGAAAANTGGTLSKYLIHAAKRFVPFRRGKGDEDEDELSLRDTTLRRFERLADGADSFFRLVESSGRPRRTISMPSLTQSLLSGDSVEFCIKEPGTGSSDLILLWPWMDPDDAGDGLVACLFVLHEDEEMWQKNLKMIVLFRLSEASDVLAIATSCLEHLPPQFGAAGVTIRRLLNQTVASQSRRSNNLSAKSMWIRRLMQDYLRSDCDPASSRADLQCSSDDARMVLPQPVLRVTTHCYASPPPIDDDSPLRNGFPLHLVCHVSPYLLPEKYSSRFLQVDDILEMLPKVAEGFYDDETQAMECERQIWCPQSAMYCSVAPEMTQPLTLSKAYLMENPSTTRRRTRRRRASHTTSK